MSNYYFIIISTQTFGSLMLVLPFNLDPKAAVDNLILVVSVI